LAEESVLSDEFVRQLINVGEVDLLVAVPTHNDAKTIGGVVQAVRLGLLKGFPRERAVLVNADAGSRDGSRELVLQASNSLPADAAAHSLRTFHTVTAVCGNGTQTPSALRPVLAAADLMQAKACAVVSPSEQVTPDWVEHLLAPVYRRDFDLVTPLYCRHKFDGLLIKLLLFPMVRALWGKRIHEPYSSNFAFSGRLGADLFTREELWQSDAGEIGEPLLLSLSAVTYGYKPCEVFLGQKEVASQTTELVPALRQAVGTMYRFLDTDASWQKGNGSEAVPSEGPQAEITCDPVQINPQRMLAMFQSGVADLEPVLASILTPSTLADLHAAATLGEEHFRFPDDLWAKTVYEFAAAYHESVISRDHIIQALAPLYRGKAYEFLTTNREAASAEVESRIEALGATFERLKPYLLQIWNRGEGGTP
jgi:hypothetical protein